MISIKRNKLLTIQLQMVEKTTKKATKPFTNWEDFIQRELPLEKKRSLLRLSTKLFFLDPKLLRRELNIFICKKKSKKNITIFNNTLPILYFLQNQCLESSDRRFILQKYRWNLSKNKISRHSTLREILRKDNYIIRSLKYFCRCQ